MSKGNQDAFYEQVYAIVRKIPAGAVATYGQLAMLAGKPRAARQVGYAMSRVAAKRRLPCHRVVNQQGRLSPDYVFGDFSVQHRMLTEEGITFLPDGRINMKRHRWRLGEEEATPSSGGCGWNRFRWLVDYKQA